MTQNHSSESKPLRIAIYGAGGLGKEVKTVIDAINRVRPSYKFMGYFDDSKKGDHIIGNLKDLNAWADELYLVVGIGSSVLKKKVVDSIKNKHISYATLIHPNAIIGDHERVSIGEGTVITAGVIITTDVKISSHVLINLNATIGHDAIISDFCSIMPGVNVAGAVEIGSCVLIGSGANIINEVHIGNGAIVGAGAVVTKHVSGSKTVVGVPAREK